MATQTSLELQPILLERLENARTRSDELFAVVHPDALYDRPIPERHRIIFYLGHLEAFDWNLLHQRVLQSPAFHPEFDRLFAFGIDPVGEGLPTDTAADWPSIAEVRQYVRDVRQHLDRVLAQQLSNFGREENKWALEQLLNVAIEHRLMHVETLAYMLHQLPLDRKVPPRNPNDRSLPSSRAAEVARNSLHDIPQGIATLGLARNDPQFGWDNEYKQLQVHVPEFAIDEHKTTNREFIDFIQAGGYHESSLWKTDDWNWIRSAGIAHPVFWTRRNDKWLYRTMFEEIPLPLDWPVYVSHAEASAYARWRGKALPTEAQWHRAAVGTDSGERAYPWGNQPGRAGNFDFRSWDPAPVESSPAARSAFGVDELLGNGWEWTSTVFAPFPGFERFSFYPGYSENFFDGKHFVMKGASARTAACMTRRSFRNWFQSHYQYVYAGFRCVEN